MVSISAGVGSMLPQECERQYVSMLLRFCGVFTPNCIWIVDLYSLLFSNLKSYSIKEHIFKTCWETSICISQGLLTASVRTPTQT